jgi:hypothetical protein
MATEVLDSLFAARLYRCGQCVGVRASTCMKGGLPISNSVAVADCGPVVDANPKK